MTKSKRKSQLEDAIVKLMENESSDYSTRKRLVKEFIGLTRKVAGKVYDVRQYKYVKPSSLEEELRLSIDRCHIYGNNDIEDLYPLDLIEKMSRTMPELFSRNIHKNVRYLNGLIESSDYNKSSIDFKRIVIQLAFYAAMVVENVNKIELLRRVDINRDSYPELYKRFNGNKIFVLAVHNRCMTK